jgi:hypothetical protein
MPQDMLDDEEFDARKAARAAVRQALAQMSNRKSGSTVLDIARAANIRFTDSEGRGRSAGVAYNLRNRDFEIHQQWRWVQLTVGGFASDSRRKGLLVADSIVSKGRASRAHPTRYVTVAKDFDAALRFCDKMIGQANRTVERFKKGKRVVGAMSRR